MEKTTDLKIDESETKPVLEEYDQTLLESTTEELPDWGEAPDALPEDWPAQGHVPGEAQASEARAQTTGEAEKPAGASDELQQAKAKLLAQKFNMTAAEVEAKLMPVVFSNPQASQAPSRKELPRDPRIRPAVAAPTGGA